MLRTAFSTATASSPTTPWIATGHLPDVAMITPIFRRGALVGIAGTAAHSPDIGGTPSMGATDLISEGILIRTSGCTGAGRVERGVMDLLLADVRLAEQLWSDLEVQANAHAVCRRRAQEFLDDHDGPDYKAMDRDVAEPLGLDRVGAASGIVEVATASIAAAARGCTCPSTAGPADFAFGGPALCTRTAWRSS